MLKGNCKVVGSVGVVGTSTRVDILLYNRLNIDPAITESAVWVVARHILYDMVHIASPICSSKTYNLLVHVKF